MESAGGLDHHEPAVVKTARVYAARDGRQRNIVWLVHMPNITTKARLRDLEQHGFGVAELVWVDTPRGWPQSGFQLVAAHLKRGYSGPWKQCRLDGQATVCEPVLEEN